MLVRKIISKSDGQLSDGKELPLSRDSGFRVQGFGVLGFRGSGVLGIRGLGFRLLEGIRDRGCRFGGSIKT